MTVVNMSDIFKYSIITVSVLVLILVLNACSRNEKNTGKQSDESLWDTFYTEIMALPDSARQNKADEFITKIENSQEYNFPLVQGTKAVFIYTADLPDPPGISGDFTEWEATITMQSISGTSLWYHVAEFPETSRLDYKFAIGSELINDPRNPRFVTGGYGPNSEIVMPGFVDPPEIEYYENIPHGKIITSNIHSKIRNNDREVHVYLPPGYNAESSTPYPSIYVLDGGDYLRLAAMNNVLDYCIDKGICEPLVAVMVDPVNRMEEYWLNESFVQFFIEEMVPFIDSEYNLSTDPARRCIMGASLGGVTSVQLSYLHPEVFGNAGCQSSALWINEQEMIGIVENGPTVNVDYYFDMGLFEGDKYLNDTRRLFKILSEKGYNVAIREYPDGHSWGNWRGHIDNILEMHFPVGK